MKKILCFLLIVLMLSGCAAQPLENAPSTETTGSPYTEGGEYKVADCRLYEELKTLLQPGEGVAKPAVNGNTYADEYYHGEPIHASGKAVSYPGESLGFPFLVLSGELAEDPFASMDTLIANGYLEKVQDVKEMQLNEVGGGWKMLMAEQSPERKVYPYNREGCSALVKDVAASVAQTDGGEKLLLRNDEPLLNVAETSDGGYFGSAVIYNTSYCYALSMYIRSADGKTVTDVMFRFLMITYPYGESAAGVSMNVAGTRDRFEFDAITMAWALESLLTGENHIVTEKDLTGKSVLLPESYTLGDMTCEIRGAEYETKNHEDEPERESFFTVEFHIHT